MAGEPDAFVRPESTIVKMSDFGQGIEAATMSIAGEVIERLEFAKDGEIGTCAEDAFELG
jgi:hypothetical protein